MATGCGSLDPDEIQRRVAELGPWFHNIDLDGVQTAPEHFLGDYPQRQMAASPMRSQPT